MFMGILIECGECKRACLVLNGNYSLTFEAKAGFYNDTVINANTNSPSSSHKLENSTRSGPNQFQIALD